MNDDAKRLVRSHPMIAIDGSRIDRFGTENGQYRYLIDLISGFIELGSPYNFVLLGSLPDAPEPLRPLLAAPNWTYHSLPHFTGRGWYYRAMLSYRYPLRSFKVDLMHSLTGFIPLWAPCPVVATRLDLMYELFPEYEAACSTRVYRLERWMNRRRVARILAISNTTASDVNQRWNIPRDTIDVVMLGSRFDRKNEVTDSSRPAAWPNGSFPLLLTPYNLEPRKNLSGLLRAFPRILQQWPEAKLICFGRTGWSESREAEHGRMIEELGISGAVVRTGFVDDAALIWMYRHTTLFVAPTLYEGFGLPILEAMASGACVVARNASAMAEVVGDCGVLTETTAPEPFAESICRVLADDGRRARLAAAGSCRARTFTIERMALGTLNCYERALGSLLPPAGLVSGNSTPSAQKRGPFASVVYP